MKGVRCRTRREWIRRIIGPQGNLTAAKMIRAIRIRRLDNWHTAMPATGPDLEQIAFVHGSHPVAPIIKAYNKGDHWFDLTVVEKAIGAPLHQPIGAIRLAQAGFAIQRLKPEGRQVEFCAAAPNEARYVNEARTGAPRKGYSVQRIVDAFLHVRHPLRPRINITDARRLRTVYILENKWGIRCDDLLAGRSRVRLVSNWTLCDLYADSGGSVARPGGRPYFEMPRGTCDDCRRRQEHEMRARV